MNGVILYFGEPCVLLSKKQLSIIMLKNHLCVKKFPCHLTFRRKK